jgi:hypothetical protein
MPHGAELSATTRMPFLKPRTPSPDFLDRARQFMPEQRRRHNHAGVIAPLIHLQIRAAGQRHVDLDQNFALSHTRDRHSFNLDVFFAVEDGSRHLAIHS